MPESACYAPRTSRPPAHRVAPRVVVVGAGISGLAAAWHLSRRRPDLSITVLDGSSRVGGKLWASEVAGVPVDAGAEAMLNRRPEAVELTGELGLADRLCYPTTTSSSLWIGDALRPIPAGTVMGVPADLDALAASGVLSADGLAACRRDAERLPASPDEPTTPAEDWDVSIGEYVAERLGPEVVDRIVEPLLGGVYAGHARELSLRATVPQLAQAAAGTGSLVRRCAQITKQAPAVDAPVFAGLDGGVAQLTDTLARALVERGVEIRTEAMVQVLQRGGHSGIGDDGQSRSPDASASAANAAGGGASSASSAGWRLEVGPRRAPQLLHAEAVILACPARSAGRLVADTAPQAANALLEIDYASVATVTLAYPRASVPGPLPGSGFLVPPVEGRLIKAVTFASQKWEWLFERAPELLVLRCSVGRYGDEASLQYDDAELVRRVAADVGRAIGVTAEPIDTRVTRWGGALPQYTVGHRDRVTRVYDALADHDGLAVCGAAYEGLGIPACIATARAAAEQVAGARATESPWRGQ